MADIARQSLGRGKIAWRNSVVPVKKETVTRREPGKENGSQRLKRVGVEARGLFGRRLASRATSAEKGGGANAKKRLPNREKRAELARKKDVRAR